MTHELPPDVHTLLALLQLEVDASADPTEHTQLSWWATQKALWANKVTLTQQLDSEKAKVARLETEKQELTWKYTLIQMNLEKVQGEFNKFKAEIAKERAALAARNREELEANQRATKAAKENSEKRLQAEREADALRKANYARRVAEVTRERESAEAERRAARDKDEKERGRSEGEQDKESEEEKERRRQRIAHMNFRNGA